MNAPDLDGGKDYRLVECVSVEFYRDGETPSMRAVLPSDFKGG